MTLEKLLNQANNQNASDIHIEPFNQHSYRTRLRCDGLLHTLQTFNKEIGKRLLASIKASSHLNLLEKRLPQDGRLDPKHHKKNYRVSICPTHYGEKCVIRILNNQIQTLDLENLGQTNTQQQLFRQALAKPQGLILITGPTGSGKTVTLYSALNHINHSQKNLITIEDPIEIDLEGVNQMSVNPAIELDFANLLRASLRQDPDIMMIGEIRDLETAEIALHAAQTGHLVLSTLHTNSAVETLTRLQMMNINRFNLVNSLQLVIAQRLIRKRCLHCTKQRQIAEKQSCSHCYQGFKGRTGIFEVLPINDQMRHSMLQGDSEKALLQHAMNDQMMSLRSHAQMKIDQQLTTSHEVNRVLGI